MMPRALWPDLITPFTGFATVVITRTDIIGDCLKCKLSMKLFFFYFAFSVSWRDECSVAAVVTVVEEMVVEEVVRGGGNRGVSGFGIVLRPSLQFSLGGDLM